MRGRKEAFWAVVISAALVTSGFILSCGDEDGNGGAEVSCQDACEKLEECEWIPYGEYFGYTVNECVDACEEETAGGGGDFAEIYECVTDTDCDDLITECFCKIYCEKLDDCGINYWYTMDNCISECEYYTYYGYLYIILCTAGYSSCNLIDERCAP